ncbi:acyl carrier protein [Aliarcobacter cryaerophilus]|uniref:acyl carrier protein n=1 Tax=Aliarcobacter TaxID=2321111 RepID=UPI0029BF62D3|nr:acyl carrier protein [Aliarcobacter skirrowii]MDX4050852.1 acyl carrier protein [Aliarcobacter skirrowii]
MKNRVNKVFSNALGISLDKVTDSLEYNSILEWDSVAHMALISELEEEFDIMLDTDDIINMSSVLKAKEIIGKYI